MSEMYRVEYLETALADLKEIALYIRDQLKDPEAAERLLEKIVTKAETLSVFPYGRPVYLPMRKLSHEYRTVYVDHYTVFYWISEERKTVCIARVVYSRRNMTGILK